jgi:hypothetical protein
VVASSIRATQITRFRAMPTVKVGSQVVDHVGYLRADADKRLLRTVTQFQAWRRGSPTVNVY